MVSEETLVMRRGKRIERRLFSSDDLENRVSASVPNWNGEDMKLGVTKSGSGKNISAILGRGGGRIAGFFWRRPLKALSAVSGSFANLRLQDVCLSPERAARPDCIEVFSYLQMKDATQNFSEDLVVGSGGFGRVFRGTLPFGKVVAVKQMSESIPRRAQGEKEFRVEVDILSRVWHSNLVRLIGYSTEQDERILVYEYVSNGSLQEHLHGVVRTHMNWKTRVRILLGAARGLAFLHSGGGDDSKVPIVHRDFKSSNILLDRDFRAKVSDFGLAKLTPETGESTEMSTRVVGTFGYVDPEYTQTGMLTSKSDVYAFGVVMLEVITGRRPVNHRQAPSQQSLVSQTRPYLLEKKRLASILDPEILPGTYPAKALQRLCALASRCVDPEAYRRPKMSTIAHEIEHAYKISVTM